MPTIITRGGMSAQGFGFGATTVAPLYVEDVFSTWLYTGNGSNQTITNGIDLAGKGGLVWIKARSSAQNNVLADTANGTSLWLSSNTTDGQSGGSVVTAFSSTGFNTGGNTNYVAGNGVTYASWTFREAANFFDVVTYTGTAVGGVGTQTITHQLGSAPGTIIVKRTDSTSNWFVYHRSLGASKSLFMNTTGSENFSDDWNYVTPSATSFDVGPAINVSGGTYVAYLFAHDTSSTGLIQCGSYTGTGASGNFVSLGWEPQWLLIKRTDVADNWTTFDMMRSGYFRPNTSEAELGGSSWFNLGGSNLYPRATGFQIDTAGAPWNASGGTYIYIAIRRGPMRTPTLGTSVFSPVSATPTGSDPYITAMTTNFPVDLTIDMNRQNGGTSWVGDRLRGGTKFLATTSSGAEDTYTTTTWPGFTSFDSNTSITQRVWSGGFGPIIGWNFRRAPSFFDVVCYTGTGSATTFNHNLGVAPELMLVKQRNSVNDWPVYGAALPNANTNRLILNGTQAATANSNLLWNSTSPTSTVFSVGTSTAVNGSGSTYVAYLFASCPGVSKVGSYTGTGALQTINCSFTTGARFVLIKRTDSTGDWYVWDSARGITSGNDPYQLLNSTDAEVTGTNYVDTDTTGFQVTAAAPAGINANGGSYIFLAVA